MARSYFRMSPKQVGGITGLLVGNDSFTLLARLYFQKKKKKKTERRRRRRRKAAPNESCVFEWSWSQRDSQVIK